MRLVVSLYVWLVWVVGGVVGIPLMVLAIALLPRRSAYVPMRAIVRLILAASGVRVRQRGLEQLDLGRPYVLIANHVNLLDPFLFMAVLPVPCSGVEKEQNFRIPFYGWLIRRWGNVPLDRTNPRAARESLKRCAALLQREQLWMLLTPEGTRTRDGTIAPFKKGVFHVPLDAGVAVVPVTLNGAFEVQARGSFWARPGVVELVFAAPVDPAAYGNARLGALANDVREIILASFTGPREVEAAAAEEPSAAAADQIAGT